MLPLGHVSTPSLYSKKSNQKHMSVVFSFLGCQPISVSYAKLSNSQIFSWTLSSIWDVVITPVYLDASRFCWRGLSSDTKWVCARASLGRPPTQWQTCIFLQWAVPIACAYLAAFDLRGRGGGIKSCLPLFCNFMKYFCAWLRICRISAVKSVEWADNSLGYRAISNYVRLI